MRLIGHLNERELLSVSERRGRLPHAMLFSGPASTGKRIVALELTSRLLAKDSKIDSDQAQALISRGEHPDLHMLSLAEDKKDISIEQVRNLISELQLLPYYSSNRVAIIDDAHLLSGAASNALLLTLEEPPRGCHIILVTEQPHRLLPTILSRTQELSFGQLSETELQQIIISFEPPGGFEQLLSVLEGSLAPLELSQFRLPQVAYVSPSAELKAHLGDYLEKQSALSQLVDRALESSTAADALNAAVELTAKDLSQSQMMRTLLTGLRKRMGGGEPEEIRRKAGDLLKAVETVRLITERNLSPALQLSELLVAFQQR